MPVCDNSISIVYVAITLIGILILTCVALRPQSARQKKADEKFKEESLQDFLERNKERYKSDYKESPTKGYGGITEEDLPLWTESYYIDRRAKDEFYNLWIDHLKYPPVWRTDARLIVIGTLLSVTTVLLSTLLPAC